MSRIVRLLNSRADVYREQRTADGMGGFTTAWALAGTVPARFAQSNATEQTIGGQSGETQFHSVYLNPDADVRRGDELRKGQDTYLVMSVSEPSMPGVYLLATCRYRQAGV